MGSTDRELMSAADVGRTVSRIAHQIIEKTALDGPDAPRVVLLGIPTRGVTLANRLAAKINEFSGVTVARGGLDITLYRDDLDFKPPRALEETSIPAGGIDDALVILVDDVLYTGRSVRSALDALRDIGRPKAVQLAVLVDRGHRELPLRADYVGKNVPTSRSENVKVRLVEDDDVEGIWIAPQAEVPARDDDQASAVGRRPDPRRGHRDPRQRRPVPAGAAGPRGQEAADAARAHHHHDVLRELHPHPGVVRGGRQVDERRRDQRQLVGVLGGQG